MQYNLTIYYAGNILSVKRCSMLQKQTNIPCGWLNHTSYTKHTQFGDEVYDIFSTSRDQKELEIKIVAAYDKVKNDIDSQRIKIMETFEKAGMKYEEKNE